MLPIIQSLWIGNDLSQLEKLCIKSFLDHGHEFHLYTYADIGGIPEGTTIKDGNEILPESDIFYTRKKYIAPFSDWFRYALLAKRGGVWVDMDTICIKPFDFPDEIVFGYTQAFLYSIGVLKFPKNHFLCAQMANACRYHTEIQPWDDVDDKQKKRKQALGGRKEKISYQSLGNHSFGKAILHYGLEEHGKPYMWFYVSNRKNLAFLFDDSFKSGLDLYPTTYSLHISNKVLSGLSGFDKNANFSEHSAFEQLKRKHGISPVKDAPMITHEQIRAMFSESERSAETRPSKLIRRYKQRALILMVTGVLLGFLIGLGTLHV